MSYLKPGTRCVIVAGCPENIGMVVEVVERIGECGDRSDAYAIRTLSGRKFSQFWHGNELRRGTSDFAITDRHKLRPMLDIKDVADEVSLQSVLQHDRTKAESTESLSLTVVL